MPLSTGDKLGPYEIVSPLGEGGMGEVYKARDTRLERSVGISMGERRWGALSRCSGQRAKATTSALQRTGNGF